MTDPNLHSTARVPHGDDVDAVIESALDRLDERRRRVRDPETGRWTTGNGGALVTGQDSESFWTDLETARATIVDRVARQIGLTGDDAPETAVGVVEAYAEARLIRRSEFLQLVRVEDQPGDARARRKRDERRRRHLAAWGTAFDREMKAASALGLERREKVVDPLTQYLDQRAEETT